MPTLSTTTSFRPGAWVATAQRTLDELAAMSTIDEVEHRFGTARNLAEAILGFPVSGGSASRKTVRAVGHLLQHHLGPALATEALSWAASITGAVDLSTVELFLEQAARATATHRPRRLEDRHELQAWLRSIPRPAPRRRALFDLWSAEVYPKPVTVLWPPYFDEEHLEVWLGPQQPPLLEELRAAGSDDEQLSLVRAASPSRAHAVASSPDLFELPQAVVAHFLVEHTAAVLSNPASPVGLRDRIRHPYDGATLELAIRAGQSHHHVGRVRRLLADLQPEMVAEYLSTIPAAYLAARAACGLLSADDLIDGDLRDVDLGDRQLAESVIGGGSWLVRMRIDLVVELLLRHPQAAELTWVLDRADTSMLPSGAARRLVDGAPPSIAARVFPLLPPEELRARDSSAALACGPYTAARCPGIPAASRPVRPISRRLLDDIERDRQTAFLYPTEILALAADPYPEAPGWSVTLPAGPDDLRRNARLMHNCTAMFLDHIEDEDAYLLIVHAPDGARYNAAICNYDGTYWVGQINSWCNGGIEPEWLRPALERRLVPRPRIGRERELFAPSRERRDRRDNRRRKASAARRRRRG